MEEESEGWLRSGCAEGERKGVEGGKSVRALPRGRVRREFFARRLGTMGEPVERGVEGGGGRREERGGPPLLPGERAKRGGWDEERKEGGGKWRLMESRRRKIPKETTRLAISLGGWWRFLHQLGKKIKAFPYLPLDSFLVFRFAISAKGN